MLSPEEQACTVRGVCRRLCGGGSAELAQRHCWDAHDAVGNPHFLIQHDLIRKAGGRYNIILAVHTFGDDQMKRTEIHQEWTCRPQLSRP